jgi:hypothetical protein
MVKPNELGGHFDHWDRDKNGVIDILEVFFTISNLCYTKLENFFCNSKHNSASMTVEVLEVFLMPLILRFVDDKICKKETSFVPE